MISSCGGKDRERERSLIHLSHSLSGNSKRERNKEESFVGQTEGERERERERGKNAEKIRVDQRSRQFSAKNLFRQADRKLISLVPPHYFALLRGNVCSLGRVNSHDPACRSDEIHLPTCRTDKSSGFQPPSRFRRRRSCAKLAPNCGKGKPEQEPQWRKFTVREVWYGGKSSKNENLSKMSR